MHMNELGALFDKYGCDKASKHGYDTVYRRNLAALCQAPIRLLEIGVFRGASIKAWLEYFPNATIYGIDTFQRVEMEKLDIFGHKRVKLLKHNSLDENVNKEMKVHWGEDIAFDVIIDDGLHTPEANLKTLVNTIEFLKPNGMYFIEDTWPLHLMDAQQMTHSWITLGPTDYTKAKMQMFIDEVYKYHVVEYDLRKTRQPDSYMFMVAK
jgi:hypothetical protein